MYEPTTTTTTTTTTCTTTTDPIRVGGNLISPATSVRDLGIYLDSDASMRTRFEDRVELLCRTPPDPQHTSVCFEAGDAVHGGVAGSAAT